MRDSVKLRSAIVALAAALAAGPASALTIEDVKQMVAAGVPDKIVMSTIANSETVFQLSAADIVDLKKTGVSDGLIQAMQATAGASAPAERPAKPADEEPRRRSSSSEEEAGPARSTEPDEEPPRRRATEEETPKRAPAVEDEGDGEEEGMVRRRGGSKKKKDSADDEGGSGKVKRKPKELTNAIALVKEGKCLTATKDLYKLLDGAKYPEYEYQLNYYLGECFDKLGYLHTSQTYFQKVVKEGTAAGVFFGKALQKMVYISDQTKDPIYLIKQIHKIDPDDYPGSVKDDLYYFAGVRAFEDKDYNQALRSFGKLGRSNEHYLQGRYYTGVIYNAQGKKKQAFSVFKELVKADPGTTDAETVSSIRQLARLNLARVYYGVGQWSRAIKAYDMVPRLATYWRDSLFERSWAAYRLKGEGLENHALGDLLSLKSPYFQQAWQPDVWILEALVYFGFCEFGEVDRILTQFQESYQPVEQRLGELLTFDKSDLGAAAALYEDLYGKRSDSWKKLPPGVFAAVEADRTFAGPHQRVLQIEKEMERARGQKDQWRDAGVAKALMDDLERERKLYGKLAGAALALKLGTIRDGLINQIGQSEIIKFEVISGQYKTHMEAFKNPAKTSVNENIEFLFATNPELIYWPFNNEYWEDELGFYERSEPGACTN
jgi:tetratricopeptide (TPR) repeat protein